MAIRVVIHFYIRLSVTKLSARKFNRLPSFHLTSPGPTSWLCCCVCVHRRGDQALRCRPHSLTTDTRPKTPMLHPPCELTFMFISTWFKTSDQKGEKQAQGYDARITIQSNLPIRISKTTKSHRLISGILRSVFRSAPHSMKTIEITKRRPPCHLM